MYETLLVDNLTKTNHIPYDCCKLICDFLPPSHRFINAFWEFVKANSLELTKHQEDGFQWCIANEITPPSFNNSPISGGIVAYEMGLGKTILMLGLMQVNPKQHTLIVVPTILLGQWKKQIKEILNVKALVFHGTNYVSDETINNNPIVLTTYGMVKKSLIANMNWDRIICDEAHHLRNSNSKKFENVSRLSASHRWLLTGTPVQNKKSDFHSLMKILGINNRSRSTLQWVLENVYIEKRKEDVSWTSGQLPQLISHTINVPWSNNDEKQLSCELHRFINLKGESDEGHKFGLTTLETPVVQQPTPEDGPDNVINPQVITSQRLPVNGLRFFNPGTMMTTQNGSIKLEWIIKARQLCSYPKLMERNLLRPGKCAPFQSKTAILEAIQHSSKMDAVISTLREKANNGNRKVVFCQFRGEIDVVKTALIDDGIPENDIAVIDGRLTQTKRNSILQTPIQFMIIQIQTGSEGLNLQAYNEVFFLTPNWNPTVEAQAIARCHRHGQTKDVHCYHFIMSNLEVKSLDSYVEDTQEHKRRLARSVVSKATYENPR